MEYKLKLFSTYNATSGSSDYTGESQLHEVQEIKQDGDKFIDDEFFSFEAKKLSLSFIPNETECALKLKEYIECNEFIIRNYSATDDGYVRPSVYTSFINRRIEIWTKETWESSFKLVFSGVPDISSFSKNYKTNTYQIDLASIYFLFFDNMEEMSELNIFNSYFMDNFGETCVGELGYHFDANDILNAFIGFYRKHGIDLEQILTISDSFSQYINLNSMPIYLLNETEDFGAISVYKKLNIFMSNLENKNIVLRDVYENMSPYRRGIYDSYVSTLNTVPITINFRKNSTYPQETVTTSQKIVFKCSRRYLIENDLYLKTEETSIVAEQLDELITYLESFYPQIRMAYWEYSIADGNLSNVMIAVYHNVDSFNAFDINVIPSEIISFLDTYRTNKINLVSPIKSITYNNLTYSFSGDMPSIIVTGTYLSQVFVKSNFNTQINKYEIVTDRTNGIFNPSVFNAKDFLKYILIISGAYMIHEYLDGFSNINLQKSFNTVIDSVSFPADTDIIDYSCKKIFINLNKEFADMDFSETDNHYLIRGLLYYFKWVAGGLQSVFNLSIIKSQTYITNYTVSAIMQKSSGEKYYINSVEIEEDIINLEIILLTNS